MNGKLGGREKEGVKRKGGGRRKEEEREIRHANSSLPFVASGRLWLSSND